MVDFPEDPNQHTQCPVCEWPANADHEKWDEKAPAYAVVRHVEGKSPSDVEHNDLKDELPTWDMSDL